MDGVERPATNAVAARQLRNLLQYKRLGGQPLVNPRQSALQRIQVGLVGLVAVLLFVSLANMVLDRVAKTPPTDPMSAPQGSASVKDSTPDEPLAELGVTPVASDAQDKSGAISPPSANDVRVSPSR
jgi:hypothetical protein